MTSPDRPPTRQYVDPAVSQAVAYLRSSLTDQPKTRTTRIALDGIMQRIIEDILASGDPDLTVPSLEEVAALFPESPIPLLHLSKVAIDRGDHDAGLRYAEAGLAVDPDYPDLLMNHALCLLETGKPEAAIEGFRHYLELSPDNPWAYNNIGDAFRTIGLYDQAENYLKLAIQQDRRFGPAYYNLALLYLDQEDWPRCVHFAQIALRHDPSNKEIHLALADAFMGLDEPQAAVQHAVIATLLDRDFAEAYETLASAYVALGMYELSFAVANEALKLAPDSWRALGSIGVSRSKQEDHAGAIHFLMEALQSDPDKDGQYSLCWELGWAYFENGEYGPALEYTERAIQMKEFPDHALAFNKGLILLAQGKVQEAEAVYERAIARARALDDYGAIQNGLREAKNFVAQKGLHLDPGSPLARLLAGATDRPT